MPKFDFAKSCAYDVAQKRAFHAAATKVLRHLAVELDFKPGTFELRSNMGGIAVSGEITLHHKDVYIQVSQSTIGLNKGNGVLIRTCEGMKDYSGGPNNFLTYDVLEDVEALADQVRHIQPKFVDEDVVPSPSP
ncbi:hypothetical protein [Bosea sp. RAC05]|uniref:hypothetical protein n=1 Tax=Bosea sp. RAC05 TaxID=1842539 RepID=UPI00083DA24D|nr:hypothetical protein [Bosea sp. RAC05]AOG02838.1 hypothetical protein BSY19_5404 [Bosea sp. RAC05]